MSHARLSPSAAERWMNCPGAPNYEALYEDVSSAPAIDGTGSHLLLELCLIEDRTPESFVGEIIGTNHHDKPNGWLVRNDRAKRVQVAIDYINGRDVEAESKSDLGIHFGRSDLHGTCDVFIIETYNVLGETFVKYAEAVDYKDGTRFVSEKRNKQLTIYLAGKVYGYKVAEDAELKITIIQPKTKPAVRSFSMSYDTLVSEVQEIIKAAEATDDFDAPLNRGKWCHYCKHKPNCGAKVGLSFLDKPVDQMTPEEITEALDQEKIILDKYKLIKEEAEKRVHELKGYAMRPGKGSNKFTGTEKEIVAELKEVGLTAAKVYDKKLKSYSALKKLKLTEEQSEKIEALNQYEPGKLKLTKVKTETFADMFADVM